MKYLKKFYKLNEKQNSPTEFDTKSVEQVDMIFHDFAEDNNFYKFKWSVAEYPLEEGVHWTFLSWIEFKNQGDRKTKLDRRIIEDMLENKYFHIIIYVNEKLEPGIEVPHWRDRKVRHFKPYNDVVKKVETELIPQLESYGYKVELSPSSMSSGDIYTHEISLKIDYSDT